MAPSSSGGQQDGMELAAPGALAPQAGPSTPPAGEWQAHWASTLPQLAPIIRQLKPRRDVCIMRSSQLDAARLDEELSSMLREQFLRAFALFRPATVARLQPELTLLLDFLIFRFSIWEGRPLPGMSLMNLRYRNEAAVQMPPPAGGTGSSSSRQADQQLVCVAGGHSGVEGPGLSVAQRSLYCLGAVVLRYAWARLAHHATASHWGDSTGGAWRQRVWALIRQAESGYRLASLLNFLAFLRTGRYRSLLERLLRARLVYRQPSAARAISFEYLNRQLVWSELSELLLFLLPLVNVKAIKHSLHSYLPRLPMLAGGAQVSGGQQQQERPQQQQPCGICSTAEILELYVAVPCGHRFCYYCLRSHCQADPQYSCPLCLRHVDAMQRVGAGLPKAAGSSSGGGGEGTGSSGGNGGSAASLLDRSELSLAGWLALRSLSR